MLMMNLESRIVRFEDIGRLVDTYKEHVHYLRASSN